MYFEGAGAMKKCLKCGNAASEERISVCEDCHEVNLHGDFMELFKENLAKCLFENIGDMTRVLEGSNRFIKKIEALGSSEDDLYKQFTDAFVRLYRAIDYLHRELVKIFEPEANLELLISINTAGVEEMCKLGELLGKWNEKYPSKDAFLGSK